MIDKNQLENLTKTRDMLLSDRDAAEFGHDDVRFHELTKEIYKLNLKIDTALTRGLKKCLTK